MIIITGWRTIMNMGKHSDYESLFKTYRTAESLKYLFFKFFKENGSCYISLANSFKPCVTPYSLRSSGLNVEQSPFNSKFFHGSLIHILSLVSETDCKNS